MPEVIIKQSRKTGNGWIMAVVILAVIGFAWMERHGDHTEDAETRLRQERERALERMRQDPQWATNLRSSLEKSGAAKKALENQSKWLEERSKARADLSKDQPAAN